MALSGQWPVFWKAFQAAGSTKTLSKVEVEGGAPPAV
jgi:hypothetical protein